MRYINPEADNLLPESPSTAKALIMDQFAIEKEAIRQQLQGSQSCIHLSLDSWTSGNHLSILGVIGHTVVGGQLQEYVLALQEIQGHHTGENLAPIVLAILQDYSITHKLGYIQMDNATNNDTLIAALSSGISLSLSYSNYYTNILLLGLPYDYDATEHRVRCLGHILNLVVQDFLCVLDIEHTKGASLNDINIDRRFGVLGKLHNLATTFSRDPQKLQRFKAISNGFTLPRDNSTRWSSWHKLIQRAIKLQSSIERYYNSWDKDSLDHLTQNDWIVVQQVLYSFLLVILY